MKKIDKAGPFIFWIGLSLLAGSLSALITADSMAVFDAVAKPELTPPAAVFPMVWTVLYILMGVGAALVWRSGRSGRAGALGVFCAQLAVNFFWSVLFFDMQAYLAAFLWLILLWVLILLMIRAFLPISRAAAWIQAPYLIWVTFAGYLSYMIWQMNI